MSEVVGIEKQIVINIANYLNQLALSGDQSATRHMLVNGLSNVINGSPTGDAVSQGDAVVDGEAKG